MLPARSTFTYDAVPAVMAAALREQAARIRKLDRDALQTVTEAGRELPDAKDKLQGRFIQWVEAECGFSLKTAENYMNVAKRGGEFVNVTNLSLGVVYRLTTKSVPSGVADAVLKRAAMGEVVTEREVAREVKEAIDEARDQKREAKWQQKKSTRRAESKIVREKHERERVQQEERRRKEEERVRLIALSIIKTLGEESVRFLLKNLGKFDRWDIIDKLESEFHKAHPAPRESMEAGAKTSEPAEAVG